MARKQIRVAAVVPIEIDVWLENWTEASTIEQVHREGSEAAIKKIGDLCRNYVRQTAKPKISVIIIDGEVR